MTNAPEIVWGKEEDVNMQLAHPSVGILGIGTAVPPHLLDQKETARRLAAALEKHKEASRWVRLVFRQMGVESRYTCEPNLLEAPERCRYTAETPIERIPATTERMEIFRREAVPLALAAAGSALKDSGIEAGQITHLITVSCTGMFLPGLDVMVAERLDLGKQVVRVPLTFLGCAAGLTAIRMAKNIAEQDRNAKVLIVCVELCTLHIQPTVDKEDLFAAAFFGDGAGACVVGAVEGGRTAHFFGLGPARAAILPGTSDDMVWNIGEHGFRLRLSPRIPERIGSMVPPEIQRFWPDYEETAPGFWVIHPGGRGIIDALQNVLRLTDEDTRASREVLRKFGNMSSATILFVLDEMRKELAERKHNGAQCDGLALAFGPGMQAEMLRMTYVPAKRFSHGRDDDAVSRSRFGHDDETDAETDKVRVTIGIPSASRACSSADAAQVKRRKSDRLPAAFSVRKSDEEDADAKERGTVAPVNTSANRASAPGEGVAER
jgi:predicted naringenin-chalcone synthase